MGAVRGGADEPANLRAAVAGIDREVGQVIRFEVVFVEIGAFRAAFDGEAGIRDEEDARAVGGRVLVTRPGVRDRGLRLREVASGGPVFSDEDSGLADFFGV